MNYRRVAMAAIAAWVVDNVYGFLVYGTLLTGEFALYPNVFRSPDAQMPYLPMMFVAILVAMFVMTYIYAKGYEGGGGAQEGMRFGVLIGVFNAAYVVWVLHAISPINLRLTGIMAVAGMVEWIIVGIVIGLVYRPLAAASTRRGAGV